MDTHEHIPSPQHLTIPFTVPNRSPCTVSVHLEPCADPIKHGQGLIGLYPDPLVVTGFPILHASVSSPASRTYAAIYGWIQLTNTPGEDWIMDTYPPFHDVNSPFMFWGAEPTLVDAPGRDMSTPEWSDRKYEWSARSFLCYSPDAAMTKTVVPVLGFEWGWWVSGGKVFVKKVREVDVGVWDGILGVLRGRYEGWEFREAPKGEGEGKK